MWVRGLGDLSLLPSASLSGLKHQAHDSKTQRLKEQSACYVPESSVGSVFTWMEEEEEEEQLLQGQTSERACRKHTHTQSRCNNSDTEPDHLVCSAGYRTLMVFTQSGELQSSTVSGCRADAAEHKAAHRVQHIISPVYGVQPMRSILTTKVNQTTREQNGKGHQINFLHKEGNAGPSAPVKKETQRCQRWVSRLFQSVFGD